MLPSQKSSSPTSYSKHRNYKQLKRMMHDLRYSLRRKRWHPWFYYLCLILMVFLVFIVYEYFIPFHLFLPSQSNINDDDRSLVNITSNDESAHSDSDSSNEQQSMAAIDIHARNLSQINMLQYVQNWARAPALPVTTTASSQPSQSRAKNHSSSSVSIWHRNISHSPPPLRLSPSALSQVTISSVVWDFGACGCTGWGVEAVNIIKPLSERIDNLKVITDHNCWCPGFDQTTVDTMNRLQSREDYTQWNPIEIFISHKPPSRYPQFPYHGLIDIEQRPLIVIGRSMLEVDHILPDDVRRLNSTQYVDELWVPSRFVKIMYVRHGIHPNKIRVIPLPINVDIYHDQVQPFKTLPSKHRKFGRISTDKHTFRFLSVFKWEPRKGYKVLLEAFLSEFTSHDNVQLYLQTYAYEQTDELARDYTLLQRKLNATIAEIVNDADNALDAAYVEQNMYPKIELMTKQRSMSQLASLYRTVECLVLASHGEGFGLPVMESMAVGTPVIVTKWSGLRDIVVNETYGYLIDIEGKEYAKNVEGRSDFVEDKQQWAKISVDSLRQQMRAVYSDRKTAKKIGRNGQNYVLKHFHPNVVTRKIETRMKELLFKKKKQTRTHDND